MPDNALFGVALAADVLADPEIRGKAFYYIDYLITLVLFSDTWHSLACAVEFTLDSLGRPSSSSWEPMSRESLMSLKKLFDEGALEESKVILG